MKRIDEVLGAEFGEYLAPFGGFTKADQASLLVEAREVEPELGFMNRLLALCSLPRVNQGKKPRYHRRNGPITLTVAATGKPDLPFGSLPRLVLAWVCTEAVQTQSPVLVLGESLSAFMRKLGIYEKSKSGGPRGTRTRLRNQIERLFNASIRLTYEDPRKQRSVAAMIARHSEFWWEVDDGQRTLFGESSVRLSEEFFRELIRRPLPVDMHMLRALKRCALGIDLYLWLTYVTFKLQEPARYPWLWLYRQFADAPVSYVDKRAIQNFRAQALRELKKIDTAWGDFSYGVERGHRGKPGALILHPVRPRIPPAGETT